ncbi:MAG: glycosyl transferase, partial [Alphaproteobacteria bacterium]
MIDNKISTRVVLQVLPHMNAGGLVRGAIDSAAAQVGAGWAALVASEGGHGVRELERVGAYHFHLPLASKNPIVMFRNVRRLRRLI